MDMAVFQRNFIYGHKFEFIIFMCREILFFF